MGWKKRGGTAGDAEEMGRRQAARMTSPLADLDRQLAYGLSFQWFPSVRINGSAGRLCHNGQDAPGVGNH
jgi:hypothetical protein